MSARKEDGQVVQVDRFRTVADKLCLETAERHSLLSFGDDYVQNSCFRARFMYTLLTKGYGFERWDNIRFVSEVKGQTVGWTLGYMLEETNSYPSVFDTKDVSSQQVFATQQLGLAPCS